MKKFACLAVVLLPLLGGCISDGAAWQIDGAEHSISLIREQQWLWDKTVHLSVVAARLPDCQRRHHLRPAPIAGLAVELFAVDERTYHLRQGSRFYRLETQTCEGFDALQEEPAGGLGTAVGTFRVVGSTFAFVPRPAPAAPNAPPP